MVLAKILAKPVPFKDLLFSVPTEIFKASYGPLSWCMPSFYFLPWLLNFVLYDVMTISALSYN